MSTRYKPLHSSLSVVLMLCCVSICFSVRPAAAQNRARPAGDPLAAGREALTDKRYSDAVKLLEAAAAPGKPKADEAQLLLGHALYYSKEYDKAIAAYDRLITESPKSAWRKKALFRKADCYIALKQYDKAAALYGPEMDYIVSDTRKEQVADTYLKYANQYFEPPKNPKGDTPPPNYQKAKSLYQKALEIGLTPNKTEEVLLRVAQCDFNTQNWAGALATLQQVLKDFPKGAHTEQVKYYVGLSYLRGGNDREARKVFRDFLHDYTDSKLLGDVSYALAETYHVPNPRDNKELQAGVQALRNFVAAYPRHPKALQAEYFIGLSLFNQQRYEDAVKELTAFIKNHPAETADEVAQAKNFLGLAYLRQKKHAEAIAVWEGFLRDHPVHPLWNTVQRQIIDAEYAIGDEAYTAKRYAEARQSWQQFEQKYPIDVRNADIMFRLGMILSEGKQYDAAISQWQKVVSKYADTEAASRSQFMIALTYERLNRFDDAFTAYKAVRGRWQSDAQSQINELRNRKLLVYTERTFTTTDTPALKLVTRNVKRLDLRAYKVDMKDYFGKLQTMRDVDKLDLPLINPDKRWTLDVPDYADYKQQETTAPLPFKEPGVYAVVCSIPLSDDADNKTAVAANADTPPPTLEATTVVLVTDLGIITKATHNDVFVFVENLRTKQPWPQANVLISDGRKIVATGTTRQDGIFHFRNDARAALHKTSTAAAGSAPPLSADIRVLAYQGGNYASTEGNLNGVARMAGLQPTGYLYTDRPLYRGGQPVFLRGIVRQVANGVYTFKKGDEYRVTVSNPGGTVLFNRLVKLGDFGTFNDSLKLNDDAPPGRYTILLTKPKKQSAPKTDRPEPEVPPAAAPVADTIDVEHPAAAAADAAPADDAEPAPPDTPSFSAVGYFQVAAYRLEKVRLTIDLPKSVYLRGEEIKGKVIARYLYGEPLAKRKIRFGWNREVGEEKETDAKGEFEFTIPTRPFEEDEAVALWARLEEESAQAQRVAYVATTGVQTTLTMLRDVHLIGEKFDVKVEAKDLADKPFAGTFTLHALKYEKDEAGRLGEHEVQPYEVKTGADGKATVSVALDKAGEYVLRLTGEDGNKNPVSSELATQVVGDEDRARLRVLTDTDTFKVGQTAAVRVVWRGRAPAEAADGAAPAEAEPAGDANAPQLALVTYEGERIYGYQLVTVQKSDDNEVKVPMTFPLAPVFRFSIALIDGNQFHQATKWFRVEHELSIKIKTERAAGAGNGQAAKYRPGDKVRATIETTDQNGKAVPAEVSLAVVDQALLDTAGGDGTSILTLMQQRALSDNAIATATSATFHYAAAARKKVLEVKEADNLRGLMLAGVDAGADFPRGHWVYQAIDQLNRAGIIEGYPNGTFAGAKGNITRYEAAVAVARVLDKIGGDVTSAVSRQRANVNYDSAQQQTVDVIAALKQELAPELSRLGDRSDALDGRVTALENRVSSQSRGMAGPSVAFGTGLVSDVNQGGVGGGDAGAAGAAGAPGPQGPAIPYYNGGDRIQLQAGATINIAGNLTPEMQSLIDGHLVRPGAGQPRFGFNGSGTTLGRQAAVGGQGLLYDKESSAYGRADEYHLPAGVRDIIAADPQNALLVNNPQGEQQLHQMALERNLSEAEFQQLITALRSRYSETAYWNAQIVTDAKGQAGVELTLPQNLTEWHFISRGVTADTMVGQSTEQITSSKPFSVELKTPATLQQGDHAQIAAVLHNNSEQPVQATVTLKTKFNTAPEQATPQTVTIAANSTQELPFEVEVPAAREATFNLQAAGDGADTTDTAEETMPVRPWGIEHVVTAGGVAEGDRTVDIKLPPANYMTQRLTVSVGPNIPATLIDIAANPAGMAWRQPLSEGAAHRLMALTLTLVYLRAQDFTEKPLYQRLSGEAQSCLARLVTTQNEDGGWSWTLRRSAAAGQKADKAARSDLNATADAVAALAMARQLGFDVPKQTLSTALSYLQAQFQATGEGDNTGKATILYAQSLAGTGDFGSLNRLYRLRNALNARSLALLVLSLHDAEHAPMAKEVAQLLAERVPRVALQANPGTAVLTGAVEKRTESTMLDLNSLDDVALVTLALARVEPANPLVEDLAQWLWAHRLGNAWQTPRTTAWALAALIQHAFATHVTPEKYTLAINVNDKPLQRIAVDGNASPGTINVPAALLAGPRAKVSFSLQGKGAYTYSAVLTGFTDEGLVDDAAAAKPAVSAVGPQSGPLKIHRTYIQASQLWNGKPVPRGFDTVATEDTWENYATQVPVGKRVEAHLWWSTPADTWLGEHFGNYVVVREPIPAGCRVDEDSLSGDYERYDIEDDAIVFYFYQMTDPSITYTLFGVRPGAYRVLPTKVSAFDRPGLYAYGTTRSLEVLGRDRESKDQYRLTPDELYFLGKAYFERVQDAIANSRTPDAGDLKLADQYLSELFNKDADPKGWKLRDDPSRETARMLYTLALRNGDAPATVRFFEVLRERYPQLVIPFKEIVQTAHAYGKMGEPEREVQVMRATAEASYSREAKVAGALEDEGEHLASYQYLVERAREYPDVANVETSLYALAQTIGQRADEVRQSGDKKQGRELAVLAADTLRDFLATYAENPVGDEASFAYAVNLVEQERYDEAAAWAERSVARYPDSAHADDLTYIATYANYLGEKFDGALKMAKALATGKYLLKDGTKGFSPYRPFALYIAAQIYHAQGKPDEAVKFYQQVAAQFPDARESADYFLARKLTVPEVVAVGPTEAARIKVSARNVKEAQVSVYKVDLMKFYQNRRNLLDLGSMNLAGIAPLWEGKVDLGAAEFTDKSKLVDLPLKDRGAYFVTVKALDGDALLQASGVFVRSNLELAVQEDADSGRVRVNVASRPTGSGTGPAPAAASGGGDGAGPQPHLQSKAEVWVIGSANDTFHKGTTDLRGLAVMDDIRGRPTVIAYKDGDYAFYRGDRVLQPQYAVATTPATGKPEAAASKAGAADFKEQARNAYISNNVEIQKKQTDVLRGVMGKGAANANPAPAMGGASAGYGKGANNEGVQVQAAVQ